MKALHQPYQRPPCPALTYREELRASWEPSVEYVTGCGLQCLPFYVSVCMYGCMLSIERQAAAG